MIDSIFCLESKDTFIYNKNRMKMIKDNMARVLIVTTMPKVKEVIFAKIGSERKAIKKKKVRAKIPVPTAGDSKSGTKRLKLKSHGGLGSKGVEQGSNLGGQPEEEGGHA